MPHIKAVFRNRFKSKLESDFALWLETAKRSGAIVEYRYEPFRVRLADSTYYKVDFLVVLPDGRVVLVETKGWHKNMRDSISRWRIAADTLPWFHWVLATRKRGAWEFKHYHDPIELFGSPV